MLTGRRYAQAGFLPVGRVRELRPEPDHVSVTQLDVQWEPAERTGPGSEGHAGITGLNQERASDGMSLKLHRKSLYGKLANETGVKALP